MMQLGAPELVRALAGLSREALEARHVPSGYSALGWAMASGRTDLVDIIIAASRLVLFQTQRACSSSPAASHGACSSYALIGAVPPDTFPMCKYIDASCIGEFSSLICNAAIG